MKGRHFGRFASLHLEMFVHYDFFLVYEVLHIIFQLDTFKSGMAFHTMEFTIFINNAHLSLSYHMIMNFLQTYKDIKEKGMILEKGLIKDGVIKIYKESNQD